MYVVHFLNHHWCEIVVVDPWKPYPPGQGEPRCIPITADPGIEEDPTSLAGGYQQTEGKTIHDYLYSVHETTSGNILNIMNII